jgi:hypothetical protein
MYRMVLGCSKETEAGVMRVLIGAVVGVLLMWLYQSKRVREEAERRLATAPESLRQAATSAKAVSADQMGRVVQAVEAAPVPQPIRDAFGRATMAARSTAEKLNVTPAASPAAATAVQDTPDGE